MKPAFALLALVASSAWAAPAPPKAKLSDRLTQVRAQMLDLQGGILSSMRANQEAKLTAKRLQDLLALHRQEQVLARERIEELEKTVGELEARRGTLQERIMVEQLAVRRALVELYRFDRELPLAPSSVETDRVELPRRKTLKNLVQLGVREIEALKIDLEDAEGLSARIAEERQHLENIMAEFQESEGVLELNRQLQIDLIQRTRSERATQLEEYRKLKGAESQVATLIKSFNARMEIEEAQRSERASNRATYAMANSGFAKLKGTLPFPIPGKVVAQFGKAFDANSRLNVFKKGIEIEGGTQKPVRAIFDGKVAFAGEVPTFGRMTILDHGDHFYSLVGHLGKLGRKEGEDVKAGEEIGASDESGTPVYFEIRARNIPVNPLQWLATSSKI